MPIIKSNQFVSRDKEQRARAFKKPLPLQQAHCPQRYHHLPRLPACHTYVTPAAAAYNTRCTDEAETARHSKYDKLAADTGVLFSVAAFTSYGGWGSEFRNKFASSPSTSSSSGKLKPRVETIGKFSTAKAASSAMSLPSFAVKIRACSLMLLACAPLGAAS
jgi:hypothetical protein